MYHTNLGCRSLLFISHSPTVGGDLQYAYLWLSEATTLLTMMSMYTDKVLFGCSAMMWFYHHSQLDLFLFRLFQ